MTNHEGDQAKEAPEGLWEELKKDWLFFGFCGFLVGAAPVLDEQLVGGEVRSHAEAFSELLFADFPTSIFYLFFSLALMVSLANTLLQRRSGVSYLLTQMEAHLAQRLTQLLSLLICFLGGFSAWAWGYAVLTGAPEGKNVAFVAIGLLLQLGGLWALPMFVRRAGHSAGDGWPVMIGYVVALVILVILFLNRGVD